MNTNFVCRVKSVHMELMNRSEVAIGKFPNGAPPKILLFEPAPGRYLHAWVHPFSLLYHILLYFLPPAFRIVNADVDLPVMQLVVKGFCKL